MCHIGKPNQNNMERVRMDSLIAEMLNGLAANTQTQPMSNLSAAARVYEALRQRIVSMDLPPDTTLSRIELAQFYGVSQTPVREALQKLELDGLVKIFPQSRTIVTKIDLPALYEAHFLRLAVECEAVRVWAEAPDEALVNKLRAVLEMQKSLGPVPDDMGLFNSLDEAFHQILFGGVNQLGLFVLVKSKGGHFARARRLDLPKEGKIRSILSDHEAIIAAIEARDPASAQDAMRRHLTGTVARIGALQEEHPEFFRVA